MKKKILLGVLLLLIIARVAAPELILRKLNKSLAETSDQYLIHVDEVDISLLRMAYRFEQVTGIRKKNQDTFFKVEAIDVSLAWRELFKARILTDIDIRFAELDLDKVLAIDLFNARNEGQETTEKLFPVDVERVSFHQSRLYFHQLGGLNVQEAWRLSGIEGTIVNLTPRPENPLTLFNGTGTLLESSKLKFTGQYARLAPKSTWQLTTELQDFDLTKVNPMLLKLTPLTFRSGMLELYSEVRSVNGEILGYVRPFVKKIDVMGDQSDFSGPKHFVLELLGELARFILKNPKNKTVATQIDFGTQNGKMVVNTAKVIKLALEHRFGEPLPEKMEQVLPLPNKAGEKK